MHLLMALVLAAASIRGVVAYDDTPLPGATVKVTPDDGSAPEISATTDLNGQYSFESLTPGRYRMTFELSGLGSAERTITVGEGVNEAPTEKLSMSATEVIVFNCHGPCTSYPPQSQWERPTCSDYELDQSLIDALEHGDQSAMVVMKERHAQAYTFIERQFLAAALLGTPNDEPYWNELFEDAANAVRFVRQNDDPNVALEQWCAERNLEPIDYSRKALNALESLSKDRRSRQLLLAALESGDVQLVWTAVDGLAQQRDEQALPAIARALDAVDASKEEISAISQELAGYGTEAADRVARTYLLEGDVAAYEEARAEAPPRP